MATTALQWITREAKRLKKEYPRRFQKWTQYVAQASAIYASKHRGKSPVGHKKTAMPTTKSKRRTARKKSSGKKKVGKVTRSRSSNPISTVNRHKKLAREKLLVAIGKENIRLFKAAKVRDKRKIQKKIRQYKSDYRKLC